MNCDSSSDLLTLTLGWADVLTSFLPSAKSMEFTSTSDRVHFLPFSFSHSCVDLGGAGDSYPDSLHLSNVDTNSAVISNIRATQLMSPSFPLAFSCVLLYQLLWWIGIQGCWMLYIWVQALLWASPDKLQSTFIFISSQLLFLLQELCTQSHPAPTAGTVYISSEISLWRSHPRQCTYKIRLKGAYLSTR